MPQTRALVLGDAELAVREWGDDDGVPLLYWHGLNPFGALELNEAGPAWAAAGFRVIAFAAPGIAGGAAFDDPARYRPTRLADLVVDAADHLEIDLFTYVGWSWGASLGVYLGARHAERVQALVFLDAGHNDVPGDAEQPFEDLVAEYSEQHDRYRFETWDDFLAAARETRRRWRPQLEERVRSGMHEVEGAIVARSDPRAAAAAIHGLLQEQPSAAQEALGRTGLPVLLIVGADNDTSDDVERFRAAVPQVEVRSVSAGHDLLADTPEETIEAVSTWLRSIVAGPH